MRVSWRPRCHRQSRLERAWPDRGLHPPGRNGACGERKFEPFVELRTADACRMRYCATGLDGVTGAAGVPGRSCNAACISLKTIAKKSRDDGEQPTCIVSLACGSSMKPR